MNESKALLKRLLAPLCALLLLLAAAFFPHLEEPHRLRVAPGLWPGSEALLLASDLKVLPAAQIQIIEIPWASAVMRALGSGAVDVAVVTLDGVLRMREAGQKLRVLLVLDQSVGADAVVARQEFLDMASLKGQRVGVDVRGVGAYLLINALEKAGLTLSDVRVVPLIQSEMESAMQAGEVEAVVVSEPWLTGLQSAGRHRLYDSSELKTPILRVVVAAERAWLSSRDELATLLKIHAAMAKQMRAGKPADGMAPILRREKLSAEEFAKCLTRVRPLDGVENAAMLEGANPKLAELATLLEEQMLRHGLLKSPPATDEWIDPTLFKEAFH